MDLRKLNSSTDLFWSFAGSCDVLYGQSRCVAGKYAVRGDHLRTKARSQLKVTVSATNAYKPSINHMVKKKNYTHSFHLLYNFMLDVYVFKHSFNNHVGLFKTLVLQLASQVRQYRVSLKRCNALLFNLIIEPCFKRKKSYESAKKAITLPEVT